MAQQQNVSRPLDLVLTHSQWSRLNAHLFPGDGDEHGAVIAAGFATGESADRLLTREVFPARDGVDYVPGKRGYRALTPSFIRERIIASRDDRHAYIAVHNHGGAGTVSFSKTDLESHERGYPALLDIARDQPVGAIVIADGAVAGDIWLCDGSRKQIRKTLVVGGNRQVLYSDDRRSRHRDPQYDRQVRIFGDRGQEILRTQRVGVIGVGGVGSILVELLARLGVGSIVSADPDRMEPPNLPRVVGSSRLDTAPWFEDAREPLLVKRIRTRLRTAKVKIAKRVAKQANPGIEFEAIKGDFLNPEIAHRFLDCDYIFLAADSMLARYLFNAMVHQYLIPGAQIGAKVEIDAKSGVVSQVVSNYRPVTPDSGCLLCNSLIPAARLQEEALTADERRRWKYVDDANVHAPSVITLNAVGASLAVNDYLFRVTGLRAFQGGDFYSVAHARKNFVEYVQPRRDPSCLECGTSSASRFARGDSANLPTRARPRTAK